MDSLAFTGIWYWIRIAMPDCRILHKVKLISLGASEENSFTKSALLAVAFPMLLSTSMFMLMNWTDTLMIGYYLTEDEVGIYRLAFKVAALVNVCPVCN